MSDLSIASQFEAFVTDWHTGVVCFVLAVIARLSPAGRWNYKRTQWLQKRNEQFKNQKRRHLSGKRR